MAQERILIAEDESRVAQALRRALSMPEGGGYLVETYESGEEASARLREEHFDLLITDLRMPGMSGLDLLGKCREVSRGTSCILITGYGSPQVEETVYQLGAAAYLTKPFSMQKLVQTVKNTLKQKSHASSQLSSALPADGLLVMRRRIGELREDVGAHNVLLFDQAGQLLAESGQACEFDTGAFLTLLGNAMAATNAIPNVLGDQETFDVHFHEGRKYEIFTARITDQVFLSVVFDKQGNSSRIGMVWLYLRRAVADLRILLTIAGAGTNAGLSQGPESALKNLLEQALRLNLLASESAQRASKAKAAGGNDREAFKKPLEEVLPSADLSPAPEEHSEVSPASPSPVISYEQAKALGLLNLDDA